MEICFLSSTKNVNFKCAGSNFGTDAAVVNDLSLIFYKLQCLTLDPTCSKSFLPINMLHCIICTKHFIILTKILIHALR